MKVDYTSAAVDLPFGSLAINIGSNSDSVYFEFVLQNIFPWNLFQLDSETRMVKYSKRLDKITGWTRIKALTKCALFGHWEDMTLIVPVFVKDKWYEFKAKTNYCSRCQQEFK